MPQLIRTPDQIFREEGKDIYCILFKDQEPEPAARNEILEWLATHLPNTRVENLGPSEDSGWICGYFGTLRVDLSDADLQTFCATWETPDGKSVDPRFQCYLMPFSTWQQKNSQYVPTLGRPASIGLTAWWDTPLGIVHHQISLVQAEKDNLKRHPCNHRNLWFNAVKANRELAEFDSETLTHGEILKEDNGKWVLAYIPPYDVEFPERRKREVLDWFKLPGTTEVIEDGW